MGGMQQTRTLRQRCALYACEGFTARLYEYVYHTAYDKELFLTGDIPA